MKKLSIEEMEKVEGGDLVSFVVCVATLVANGMPIDLAGALCYYAEQYPVEN
jgi:bacteriocin-like protein